ncbi:hypothetical protein K491DRAFT_276197 [Lophiostoma macrostomum CBS 122681]|uniref:Uncharacterized protein n=1 Tax=Lophiostoma macrostomum CBS 122681 TaxID=1314788 RepID=A0A6A6TE86_9PLEO|nr:hypothetical protein K491DRAFT_276197 [Lophiostoma macrostomum CBS 122681]
MYPSPPIQMADHFTDPRTSNSGSPSALSEHVRIHSNRFNRPTLPSFTLDSSNQIDVTPGVTLDYHSYSQTASPALTPLLTPSKLFTPNMQQLELQIPQPSLRERSLSQPSPTSQLNVRSEALSRPKSMTGVSDLTADCRFSPQSLPDYAGPQRQNMYTMTH